MKKHLVIFGFSLFLLLMACGSDQPSREKEMYLEIQKELKQINSIDSLISVVPDSLKNLLSDSVIDLLKQATDLEYETMLKRYDVKNEYRFVNRLQRDNIMLQFLIISSRMDSIIEVYDETDSIFKSTSLIHQGDSLKFHHPDYQKIDSSNLEQLIKKYDSKELD